MKMLSFESSTPDGMRPRIGALLDNDGRVVDLAAAFYLQLMERFASPGAAARISQALLPGDMTDFIASGEQGREVAEGVLEWVEQKGFEPGLRYEDVIPVLRQEEVKLLPPLQPPMLRDFMAFETHLKNIYPKLNREIPPAWYEFPVYYKGNPFSLATHGDDIPMPPYASELDFEFELGVIIGPGGENISVEEAMQHIYGYTIYNDFSAREIQNREMTVGLGPAKGKDFTKGHVIGPYIVTADEIHDFYNVNVVARVNGEVWCEENTGTIFWRLEDMIARASLGEKLQPGELLGTGTVGWGSGAERGKFLKPGDTVELVVEGLGILRNTIVTR